ncbi:hypothetical protein [Clostridium sp.]|jgi:septum formation topological specificity factor MinE|uniref:hypothetical protein n=1 Tax=Clostridium sp. TaxID=1506 RepID=UPI003EECEE79
MRTITQAANELGVSRKKIYNEIEKLNININKKSKNNNIEDKDFLAIKCDIQGQTESSSDCAQKRLGNVLERDRNAMTDREYIDLKERILFLEKQIEIKDEQLQVKNYQFNGLLQNNSNMSKALNLPMNEIASTKIEHEIKKGFWSRICGK